MMFGMRNPALVDTRSQQEAVTGLVNPAMQTTPEQAAPQSLFGQMRERHGGLSAGLGLLGHLLGGGKESEWGDQDLLAQQKQQQAMTTLDNNMGMAAPLFEMIQSENPQERLQAMYGLNQLGFDKDMMALAFPQLAAQLDPPSYTEGDYQRIDGVWNLVQQASDGSVKYTPMDEDFVPESRMLGADELQKGILEFNTELQKSDARLTDIDYVLEGMDAIPEEEWRKGTAGKATEMWKELTGTEDPQSLVKKRYSAIKVSKAIQNLPPGVASDKDIQLVLEPFPSENMNHEQLREYVEGLRRAEQKLQAYYQFNVGHLEDKESYKGMRTGWNELWEEMNSEGGKFYTTAGANGTHSGRDSCSGAGRDGKAVGIESGDTKEASSRQGGYYMTQAERIRELEDAIIASDAKGNMDDVALLADELERARKVKADSDARKQEFFDTAPTQSDSAETRFDAIRPGYVDDDTFGEGFSRAMDAAIMGWGQRANELIRGGQNLWAEATGNQEEVDRLQKEAESDNRLADETYATSNPVATLPATLPQPRPAGCCREPCLRRCFTAASRPA